MPKTYYTEQLVKHEEQLSKLNKRLFGLSMLRLFVFLSTALGIYYTYNSWKIAVFIAITGIVIFLLLISKYSDLQYEKKKTKTLIAINSTELKVLNRDFSDLDPGTEHINPEHFYSYDVDLFGERSFFQYSNRTGTTEGKAVYADILLNNDPEQIEDKQEAIQELTKIPEWRQLFTATAKLIKTDFDSKAIIKWFAGYRPYTPKHARILSLVFSVLSAVIISLSLTGIISDLWAFYWFLTGLFITGRYFKSTNLLSEHTGQIKDIFQQYHQLLNQIEEQDFSSKTLQHKKSVITNGKEKASTIFKKLSGAIDALDQRNNMLFGVLANGFLLWDIRCANAIEKWIAGHGKNVADWFDVITYFDAQNSLANFAYNHPGYVYPELNSYSAINAKQIGHPLLDPLSRVDSDFDIKNEEFYIITGANMAGKSTFLRTVSLNIIMANAGLPVCAKDFKYTPMKLITSMRTSDSLSDGASYFFSELQRLKMIVEALKTEKYFIILDEILKGTNSTDKATGSKKLVERLVRQKATGIIATHDLSLCKVADEMENVSNYFFEAIIKDNELSFNYILQPGVCQNMNASFLLKSMGIVQ